MNQPALVEDAPYVLESQPEFADNDVVTINADSGEIEEPDEDMPEDNEENRAVLARIEQRKNNIATEWWNLTADLWQVKEKNLHKLAGYKNIEDYFPHVVENSFRYAFHLCQMYSYFNIELKQMLADRPDVHAALIEKVKKLGVTKTKEIAIAKIDDADALIGIVDEVITPNDKGEHKTVSQIKAMLANYKDGLKDTPGTDEFDKETKTKEKKELNRKEVFKFTLLPGDAEKVKEALETAVNAYKSDSVEISQSIAFFRICEEWSIEKQASTEGTRPGLENDLKRMEEIYNVKLIAFKADERGFVEKKVIEEGADPEAELVFGQATFYDIVAEASEEEVLEPQAELAHA